MNQVYKGFLALAFVVLYSSLITIALQVGGSSIGAVPLLLYSTAIGAISLLVISYFQDRGRGLASIVKDRRSLAILGITGIFAYAMSTLFLTLGTLGTTPSISAIVYRTYPLIIALLTPLALRQKVNKRQLVSLVLGFASIGIILSNGSLTSINVSELPYIGFVLLSALSVAVTTLVVKGYNASTTGYAILANCASFLFTLFIVLIFGISVPVNLSVPTIMSILLIGGLDLGVGSVLFYYSFKVFNTSLAGMSTLAIPFLTVALSFVLLGTPIHLYYVAAAGLLTIGVLVQGRGHLEAPERIKRSDLLKHVQIFDVTSAFLNTKVDAIHTTMRGNGRVLAVKMKNERYATLKTIIESGTVEKLGLVYTHDDKSFVSMEENAFLSDILGIGNNETVLMSAGMPDDSERFFGRLEDKANEKNTAV